MNIPPQKENVFERGVLLSGLAELILDAKTLCCTQIYTLQC